MYWKLHCMVFTLDNVLCVSVTGRLGNIMFQEAFVYAFAKQKSKPTIVFNSDNPLVDTFTLEGLNWRYDSTYSCSCYSLYQDRWNCAFDDTFENLVPSKQTFQVFGYFQSWRYFIGHEEEIRRMFTFKPHIKAKVNEQLRSIVSSFSDRGVTDKTVLVGVHIRRGDLVNKKVYLGLFREFGYNVAPESYIHNAVKFYQAKFPDVLFIVCGNDIRWAREVMQKYDRVYFREENTPPEDMALLTGTHHTLMTVGTFGWWIGWLTNGTTVYYKHTYQEGTDFGFEFHGSTKDHFPPNWVGLE